LYRPSPRKPFNDWYDNVHLPDVLQTPGFVAVRRYVIREPRNGRGKYLTICEIETDDIIKTYATRLAFREKERELGRSAAVAIPNLLLHSWSDVLFRQISERTRDK
jgi:hypothetical protein